jgi:hypothetical protein
LLQSEIYKIINDRIFLQAEALRGMAMNIMKRMVACAAVAVGFGLLQVIGEKGAPAKDTLITFN